MAEFPALPLWTDAYLGDTTHLTTLEHGAYLLLLMVSWRSRDCSLADDDRLLARYAKVTPAQWRRLRPVIEDFFTVKDGRWIQRRLRDEANAVRQRRQQQVEAGRASALKRKGRHSTDVEQPSNEASTPTPISTPISIEEGEEDSVNGLDEDAEAKKPAATLPPGSTAQARDAWNEAAGRHGWAKVIALSDTRREKLRLRLKELGGLDGWAELLAKAESAAQLITDPPPTWFKFDFLVSSQTNVLKVLEGNYDRRFTNGAGTRHNDEPTNPFVRATLERQDEGAAARRR